jgi:hypothetical protein
MSVTGWTGGSAAQTVADSSASVSSVEQILLGMVERLIRRKLPEDVTYEHGPVLWTLLRLQLVRAGLGMGGRPEEGRSQQRFVFMLHRHPPLEAGAT